MIFQPPAAGSYRTRSFLFDTYEDALWHCEPCESVGALATYSTEALLLAHVAEGHRSQNLEEWEFQHTIVRPIDAQIIPDPTPYYEPEPVDDPPFPDWYLT